VEHHPEGTPAIVDGVLKNFTLKVTSRKGMSILTAVLYNDRDERCTVKWFGKPAEIADSDLRSHQGLVRIFGKVPQYLTFL
jgi:hypothetical protein